jgi:hypothetical protein
MKNSHAFSILINRLRLFLFSKKMDETSYLLSSPKNAERLLQGIENYNKGLNK